MENPSYIALGQARGLQRQMEVVANNLANVSTPGFRAERVMFRELLSAKATLPGLKGLAARTSFVEEVGTLRDTRTGGMERTGHQLDVAVNGPGYFVVEGADGNPRYTRHGNFRPDGSGKLTTTEGLTVLSESGQPITLRPEDHQVEIDRRGGISGKDGPLGKLKIVSFADEQALQKVGDNLYAAPGQEEEEADSRVQVVQGAIEGSNVQGVLEVSAMIELMRRYQSAQRLLDQEHDRARRAIDKLSRVG